MGLAHSSTEPQDITTNVAVINVNCDVFSMLSERILLMTKNVLYSCFIADKLGLWRLCYLDGASLEPMYKLSDEDKRLLYALQMRPRDAVPELAKIVGETEHTTRRRLGRLNEFGILRITPIVNLSVIGYSRYKIVFSYEKRLMGTKPALFEAIRRHPQTIFLADVGGDSDGALIAIAKNLDHLNSYIRFFSNQFEGAFSIQNVYPIIGHCFIGTRELAPGMKRLAPIEWRERPRSMELDPENTAILHHYCNSNVRSLSELARLVKIPQSTVAYRLTSMEEHGLIAGYFNAFDPVDLGMFPFHIYLSFRGLTDKLEAQLFSIALESTEVDLITRHIGSWEFALLCFVQSARSLTPLTDRLQAHFKDTLADISIVPQFHTYCWTECNLPTLR